MVPLGPDAFKTLNAELNNNTLSEGVKVKLRIYELDRMIIFGLEKVESIGRSPGPGQGVGRGWRKDSAKPNNCIGITSTFAGLLNLSSPSSLTNYTEPVWRNSCSEYLLLVLIL